MASRRVLFPVSLSPTTTLRGFKITGANNYQADAGRQGIELEPALDTIPELSQHLYFYSDGGGRYAAVLYVIRSRRRG